MNPLLKDYVDTVAGYSVSENEAEQFIQGLEQFHVDYDVKEDGFLVTKTSVFTTLKSAIEFIRRVKSFSRPVIR